VKTAAPTKASTQAGADSIPTWIERYLAHRQMLGLDRYTQAQCRHDLKRLWDWCSERAIERPVDISKPMLERYQRHLYYYRKADGQPLSARSQARTLARIKGWFRWLARHNHLPSNPASELELPRLPRQMLPQVLSPAEVEAVLAEPELATPLGLRDRAALEVLYSTGIRRMELICLSVFDIDFNRGTLFVRQGKGRKDRLVPIGDRALAWLRRYLDDVREHWQVDPKDTTLFLSQDGQRLSPDRISERVRAYVRRAGIGKPGGCHLFRHAAATAMLENGADLRYIQSMLGHASIQTTEIYTHVSIGKLKAVHAATHPGAKLARRAPQADTDGEPDA
jgi:integrase/recombinase XerD